MVTSSVPEIQFRDVDRRFQNAFELVEVAVGNLVVCMKKNRRTAHNVINDAIVLPVFGMPFRHSPMCC